MITLIRSNLGKKLFPGLAHDQRRREMRFICLAVVAGILISAVFVLVMVAKEKIGDW